MRPPAGGGSSWRTPTPRSSPCPPRHSSAWRRPCWPHGQRPPWRRQPPQPRRYLRTLPPLRPRRSLPHPRPRRSLRPLRPRRSLRHLRPLRPRRSLRPPRPVVGVRRQRAGVRPTTDRSPTRGQRVPVARVLAALVLGRPVPADLDPRIGVARAIASARTAWVALVNRSTLPSRLALTELAIALAQAAGVTLSMRLVQARVATRPMVGLAGHPDGRQDPWAGHPSP